MPDIFISKQKPNSSKEEETKKEPDQKSPVEDNRLNLEPNPHKQIEHKSSEKFESHSRNPLAAYCYLPENINFENKDQNEQVILLLRKHPITNVGWVLITTLMIFAPLILNVFPIIEFLPANFQFVAVLGWYLLTIAYALESFLTWFFNVYIITDERIVDIDFVNLIYKEISDAKIDRVQDVTYKMGGVIRTLLNYGDVYIETAGEVPAFEFLAVPKPDRVTKILQDLQVQEEQEKIEGRVR